MADKKPNIGAVVPPKIIRGSRESQIPKELLVAFAGALATTNPETEQPSWISDQLPYDTRAKANAAAMKYKKALVNGDEFKYDSKKALVSRVWGSGEVNEKGEEVGPFYFALAERPAE